MSTKPSRPALVCRTPLGPSGQDQYLRLTPDGAPSWTESFQTATAFESMREATRAALHLPSAMKAFGLPAPRAPGLPPTIH